MDQANAAFEKKEWDNAKKLYNEASSIKPNDRGPKDRIIEIDNLLAKRSLMKRITTSILHLQIKCLLIKTTIMQF